VGGADADTIREVRRVAVVVRRADIADILDAAENTVKLCGAAASALTCQLFYPMTP
jgi:hypothetical protein